MTDLRKTTPGPSKHVLVTKASEPPGSKLKTDRRGEATHQRRFPVVDEDVDDRDRTCRLTTEPMAPVLDEDVEIVNRVNAKIKWNQSVSGDEKFEICYWTDEADKKYDYTNSSNYMITNLKTGSTYSVSVKVTRVNIDGRRGRQVSATSNIIHFITAPAQPTDLRVENYESSPHDSIIVCFNDPNENREVTHKVIVEAVTANEAAIRETRNRKVLVDGLIPGVSYSVAVVTIEGELRSQPAYYDSLVTTYPAIPQGVDLAHEDGKFILRWQALEIKPSHYEVQWETNGVKTISKVSEETFTLYELKLSTHYKFRVAAVNKAGQSCLSEETSFQTAPSPPMNVRVQKNAISPTSSFIVKYEDPDPLKKSYEAFATSLEGEIVSRARSGTHTAVLNNLPAGRPHFIYVIAYYGDNMSERAYCRGEESYQTAPSKVARVEVIKDSPTSRHIVWDSTAGTSSYVVKVKKAGVPAKSMPPTKRTEFHVDKLDLHSKYSVTVMAQNDGGEGAESDEVCFETELHPPKSIKVTNDLSNPTMALSVRVEETDIPSSHYQLRIISLNGRRDEFVKITRQEAMSVKTLGGMTPGDSYQLAICSLHDSDESLNSREKFSSVIQTKTPALTVQLLKISNDKQKVTWSTILEATGYRVSFRTQYGKWQHIDVGPDETETVLENLKSGCVHEIKVIATNRAGPGQELQVQNFTTAPATPVGLDAKILSIREIQVSCDDTYGASTYVFKINGREHETDQPTFTLQHSQLNKHFQIQVFAENEGGCSSPSTICECQQVLLQLQEKFLKKAKNFQEGRFVTPEFKEVPSSNEVIDFGTEEFCVGKGKTVCVVGTDFSGKTSCCFQYLCSLSEHELGMYLDWDDYKDLKANLDIKSILLRQMKDFGESEKNFAIEWMRAHPDQVVFVVDNLVLSHSVAGKLKLWEDIATPQEIFYSLVIPTREIFPECQVLCATSQSDLRQIIKPNRTMAIIGFDEKHIKEMRGMILGEDCDIMLPTHLEYFCKNPAYCKIIFRLLKNPDANVDMKSYSSILLKLISESVSCYPEGKMKEKLRHLKDEVKNVPQKLRITKVDPSKVKKRTKLKSESATTHRSLTNASEVPSFIEILEENWQRNHSCEALHDYIVKAIFFGLFCPLNEFKNRFHKKSIKLGVNANIWILAAGLLREETVNLAADLFSAIDEKLNVKEIAKKLDFTKTFAQNNLERIHKQVLSDPVIALDWLNIINEIKGLDIIPKSKWKVSARNYHTPDEIEQMASFLRQVRGMFFGHLRVKLEKDLTPEKRLSIETALRENPYGEVRVSNSKPGINLTRNSPLLSFRSKSRGPSPKPASVTSSLDNSAGDTGGVFTETPDSYGNMYASLPYIPQTSQTSQFYQGRSFRSLRSAGTENLHGTSIGKEFKTDNISLTPSPETVDPEPVELVGQAGCSEQVNQPFSSEFIKVSNIFTVKTLKESESIKRCYVSVPTYCTSHTSGTPAKLMQFTGQKWKAVDDVVIVGQVACFNAIANEIYALGLDTSSIQDTIWYHLVCRTNFSGEKNLEIKISGDDRLSHIKTTDLGATEQRFVGEIGDEFNIKITSGSSVISDWRFSIRSQFEGVDKSVAVDWEAKMNSDNNVVCMISKGETIVSQARFQNPPNNDRLPENIDESSSYGVSSSETSFAPDQPRDGTMSESTMNYEKRDNEAVAVETGHGGLQSISRRIKKALNDLTKLQEEIDQSLTELQHAEMTVRRKTELLLDLSQAYLSLGKHTLSISTANEAITALKNAEGPLDPDFHMTSLTLFCCAGEASLGALNIEQAHGYYNSARNILLDRPESVAESVDLKTRIENLRRRIITFRKTTDDKGSVSQSVSSDGGVMELTDCAINFRKNSLTVETLLYAITEVGKSDPPEGMVQITPNLRLSPNTELNSPATVKLATWLASGDPKSVRIYCRNTENSEWELQPQRIRFSGHDKVEFEITRFCEFCAFQFPGEAEISSFWMKSCLFFHPKNRRLANCIYHRCDTFRKEVEKKMICRGFMDACDEDPALEVRIEDKIKVELTNITEINMPPEESQKKLTITMEFLKERRHAALSINLPLDYTGALNFNHIVKRYSSRDELVKKVINHKDRIYFESAKRPRPASSSSPIYVANNLVTGGTSIVRSSGSDTSITFQSSVDMESDRI